MNNWEKINFMSAESDISRAVWEMFTASKDVVKANLLNTVTSGKLNLNPQQFDLVTQLVDASLDESFHRSHGVFCKTIAKSIA